MKTTVLCLALVSGNLLLALPSARAADPEEAVVREQAEAMARKAQALEAEGRTDEARQLIRETQQIRERYQWRAAERARDEDRPVNPDRIDPGDEARERARARVRELQAAGRIDEAMALRRRLETAEQPRDRDRPSPERPDPPRPRPENRIPRETLDRPELQRRLEHVEVAIRNLHEAGLHELAERVAQQTEPFRRRLAEQVEPEHHRGPATERLAASLEELRHAVQEFNRRLERLEQRRRDEP